MPLKLTGAVTLRVRAESEVLVQVEGKDFSYEEGGMRVLGDQCTQHEFLYVYEEPRFSLKLCVTAIDKAIQTCDLRIEPRAGADATEAENRLTVNFEHDPDQDDEPLTPVSSN